MTDYAELLKDLSDEEKQVAIKMLQEMASGNDRMYTDYKYADYDEIPVDIGTFLHDPKYLGEVLTNSDGTWTMYPYWEDLCHKIFPDNITTSMMEVILTGGIGLGKSFEAIVLGLYMLYRVMCLKDPYAYYGIQKTDPITFALMNTTIDNAQGVAWTKMQSMLKGSRWFMERGTLVGKGSDDQKTWEPPSHIKLIVGSNSGHILGKCVFWCLDGDTVVKTTEGDKPLCELENKPIQVYSVDDTGNIVISDVCTVEPTMKTNEEYEIELEDGTVIKCTPNHRFKLKDGSYKEAQYLTEDDELYGIDSTLKIKRITKTILSEPKQFYDVINANPYNNFFIKTNSGYVCSHNCFVDEVNFQGRSQDIEKQRATAKDIIDTAYRRMESRFMKGDKNPTLLVLASSKKEEQSYLETYIDKHKEYPTTIVVDEPQWIIRTDKITGEWFRVAVGNQFQPSELIPDDCQDVQPYIDRGFEILEVPSGYKKSFKDDLDKSLADIAGKATSRTNRFIRGDNWKTCVDTQLKNPFPDIIEVGMGDEKQYSDFFDLSNIPPAYKKMPLYVHFDMSTSTNGKGDKTGLGGVFAVGKQGEASDVSAQDMYYATAFSTSIRAPKGSVISFAKNREFVRWLKKQGFNVRGVSADQFQSVDLLQILAGEGFHTEKISVDVLTGSGKDKVCLPYQAFRAAIYEKRISIYPAELLQKEAVSLERDTNGKVDHPSDGSKDQVDAICGACYHASLHTAEFVNEYGAGLIRSILAENQSHGDVAEEVNRNLEEMLKSNFDPLESLRAKTTRRYEDSPEQKSDYGKMIRNGILMWGS